MSLCSHLTQDDRAALWQDGGDSLQRVQLGIHKDNQFLLLYNPRQQSKYGRINRKGELP